MILRLYDPKTFLGQIPRTQTMVVYMMLGALPPEVMIMRAAMQCILFLARSAREHTDRIYDTYYMVPSTKIVIGRQVTGTSI